MDNILLVTQIILTILVTIVVLLQKSSNIGLGAYSGSNDNVFGAKGAGGFLAKTTFFLGFLFIVNTIALGYLYNRQTSVLDNVDLPAQNANPFSTPFSAPDSENPLGNAFGADGLNGANASVDSENSQNPASQVVNPTNPFETPNSENSESSK